MDTGVRGGQWTLSSIGAYLYTRQGTVQCVECVGPHHPISYYCRYVLTLFYCFHVHIQPHGVRLFTVQHCHNSPGVVSSTVVVQPVYTSQSVSQSELEKPCSALTAVRQPCLLSNITGLIMLLLLFRHHVTTVITQNIGRQSHHTHIERPPS